MRDFILQLLRPAPRQRRQRAAQHVIHAAVSARFFNGHDVVRFFDHADQLFVATGPRAEVTWVILGNVAADRAFADFLFRVANRIRQPQRVFRRTSQKKKRQPLCGFLSDSGQVFQFIDESFDRSGKIRHA